MEKKVFSFGKQHSIKNKFHICEESISINEVDIKRIVLSDKYIKLPQMNAFATYFNNNNKCINHLVKDEEILKKKMEWLNMQ